MDILNIRIDNLTKADVLEKSKQFLNDGQQHKIFTPNPEMLVDAQKDEYFKKVLNSGDLNVCDGVGLALVACIGRYPGTDLMQDICALAEKEGRSVYLLGSGDNKVISNLQSVIKNKFSNLKIAGAHIGYQLQITNYQLQFDKEKNDEIIHDIIMSAPDVLFVAFGHNKQEKWIYENLKHLPSVKIAMGVGGAFDYISGKIPRAPLFLRKIGLEWMYRLFREPKRIKRIWRAIIVFLFLFLILFLTQNSNVKSQNYKQKPFN